MSSVRVFPSRLVLSAVLLLSLSAAGASAQDAAARPLYFGVGLGPAIGFEQGWDAQFKIEEQAGYSFLRVGEHPGLFAGIALGQSFAEGPLYSAMLEFGARVGFAIQLFHMTGVEILLIPHTTIGAGVLLPRVGDAMGAFNLQIAAEGQVVLLDGMLSIFLRPISVDGFIRDNGGGRWDILAGAILRI